LIRHAPAGNTNQRERQAAMKIILNILGILLVLSGVVWFLQGLNILLGSFMSGQSLYTYLGLATAIVGAALLWFNNRRR
jgi:uncharacterized membrane-anchored protein YitT (DUF2179 family)